MTTATIQIEIRGGEPEGEVMRFRPGEMLQGSVQIIAEDDLQARHVFLRLVWQTEGRGDRDQEVVAELDVFQGMLRAGTPGLHSFHFKLPAQPWSYAGHYVSILWAVECSIDLPLARDLRAQKHFILAPD